MLNLSVDFLAVFQIFAPLFSSRVWPYACHLMVGAILAPGRRTVSAILRVLGCSQSQQFQNYHRVLNRAVWSTRQASKILLGLLIETFAPEGALVFGVDETIERRWGAKISARGIYRDAARSSKSVTNKTSGLRWISVQLLTGVSWTQSIWALPFLTVLAPSGRYFQRRGRKPRTLVESARRAIAQVRRWCPHRELVFVGDATYAALELLAFVQRVGVTLITPLRLDANLFEPAPRRARHRKGRPRLKGPALPKLSQRLAAGSLRWRRTWVQWHGRGRRGVELATGQAVWYHTGKPPVTIRWVIVCDPQGEFETRALLCTDPSKTARQLVELYTRRWQVEVTFEEVRAHLGVETQRQWNDAAIDRTTPALFGLFSLVTVLAHKLHTSSPKGLQPRRTAWYTKDKITFADALAAVRNRLWGGIFSWSLLRQDIEQINRPALRRFTELLCYAQ